ncbi:MAG: hypothetical protein ACRDSO_00670 [Pseudonocardiaceae bacterium]
MVSVDLDEDLVRSLSRRVVDRAAPEELPLFRLVTDAYFSQATGKPAGRRNRDEMLGFGVGEVVVLLTPFVLPVVSTVLEYLATEVAAAAGARGKEAVGRLLRRLFRQTEAPDGPVPLSREQLDHVRRLAFQKARQLDLPEAKADLLADSVVGSLAATA